MDSGIGVNNPLGLCRIKKKQKKIFFIDLSTRGKAKIKPRGKIHVERSVRVLRFRGYLQLSVEKERLDESTGSSVLPVIHGKETDEISFWEASCDK